MECLRIKKTIRKLYFIDIAIDYALGCLSNNVFASTYTYYIPKKEELISEVEKVLNENK